MSAKDAVFGGENTLLAALLETMNPYDRAGPKIVTGTCTPEVIGDDYGGIVDRVNENLPIIAVSGGFKGNHYYGINETLLQLVKKFADPYAFPEPGMVNVVGNIGGSRGWRADVADVKRTLELLGLKVNLLACNSKLDDIRNSSMAEATILINPEIGFDAAKYLQTTFDRKIIISDMGLPLGLRGTESLIRLVAKELNVDNEKLETVLTSEEETVRIKLKPTLSDSLFVEKTCTLKNMKVAIVAEGVIALSWARFLKEEMDVNPVLIGMRSVINSNIKLHSDLTMWASNNSDDVITIHDIQADMVEQALNDIRPDITFGSSIEYEFVKKANLGSFVHIANPNRHFITLNEYCHGGFSGVVNIVEQVLNAIK
jgi:nitrogenase molybdenum-iron protein alpha/beta subunit